MKSTKEDRGRAVPIDLTPDQFRRLGHTVVDRLADLLSDLPNRKVTPGEAPSVVREALDSERPLPTHGADPEALLDRATDLLFEHSLFNGHPSFWGYITSSAAPLGILADMLASGINANCGGWKLSPMAGEIELQTVRWIAELIGYPTDSGGLLVSGGNMANMVGLIAARTARAGWDVRSDGLQRTDAPKLVIYASTETHTWLEKCADIFGFGTACVRPIATDSELRMNTDELQERLKQDKADGKHPLMVIGTAGTVSTGAVDPLVDIAEICREHNLWFHVDGAYGGFAAALPDASPDLKALAGADSVAVDPHKWLYAPLEAGCALVRNPEHLRNAFSYHPPYYHFEEEAVNFVDLGPQNSRGFRALKVWLLLQQVGRDGYRTMIADDIDLARQLFVLAEAHPELEAHTHSLSITTFRYVPTDLRESAGEPSTREYLNELNQEILDRVELSGEAFVSVAVVNDTRLLRACVVNFRTEEKDIAALPELVASLGREADAELRENSRRP